MQLLITLTNSNSKSNCTNQPQCNDPSEHSFDTPYVTDLIQNIDTENINSNKSHQPVCQPVRVDAKSTEEGHDHDADGAIKDVLLCVLRHDIVAGDQPVGHKEG